MYRSALLALALSSAALLASPASAQALASTQGTFVQVYNEPDDNATVVSGVGTSELRFGAPDPGWIIRYTSASAAYSTEPFFLGSITAYNGSVFGNTDIAGMDLFLRTDITPPDNPAGDGVGTLTERITITHTPNTTDPIASADFLNFQSLAKGAWILEGQWATFNLFGTVNSPLTLSSIAVAPGSEDAGFITDVPPDTRALQAVVPEPSTWAMMLLGFGAVGFALRRSRRLPAAVPA
jgi:hypothetical protein